MKEYQPYRDRIHVIAERIPRMDGIGLYVELSERSDGLRGQHWYGKHIEFDEIPEPEDPGRGNFYPGPTLMLPMEAAQGLMDELWRAGCRPSEMVASEAAIGAVKYHLEDMRRLVFEKE